MRYIITLLLGIFVAGANYHTILLTLLIGTVFLINIYWKNIEKTKLIQVTSLYIIFCIFSFINILAPGNAVRQVHFKKMSVIGAICQSLFQGKEFLEEGICFELIIFLLILIPFLWRDYQQDKRQYKYPLFVTIISVLFFCAMYAPTNYAMASKGPERTINVYYWVSLVLYIYNFVYWLGWLYSKIKDWNCIKTIQLQGKVGFYIGVIIFICFMKIDLEKMTTGIAIESIISGEAKQYQAEIEERKVLYNNPAVKDVRLQPLTVFPVLVTKEEDIPEDPENWINTAMAAWYEKNSIALR